MTRPTIEQARSWRGLTLVATDDPVGEIEAIYVDRTTRQPEWALVDTGLVGSSRTFVPLADAAQQGDTVQVPYQSTVVREAPRLEQDAELSEADKARLYAHYGIQPTTGDESPCGLPAGGTMGSRSGRAARKAVEAGQQAAASGRLAVHKARQEVAAVVAAIETTPESKRAARRRTRARKRVMAAAAEAARSLAAVLAAALRRARKSDAGKGSS
jgi:hypothetical protein